MAASSNLDIVLALTKMGQGRVCYLLEKRPSAKLELLYDVHICTIDILTAVLRPMAIQIVFQRDFMPSDSESCPPLS